MVSVLQIVHIHRGEGSAAVSYSEALEKQLGMRDVYARPGAAEYFVDEMLKHGGGFSNGLTAAAREQFKGAVHFPLMFGDTYYVAPEIVHIVHEMATTLPDWKYRPEQMLSQAGFVWLSDPVHVPGSKTGMPELQAIGWFTSFNVDGQRMTYALPVPHGDEDALSVCFYMNCDTRFPAPLTVVHVRPGGSLLNNPDVGTPYSDPPRMDAKLRLFGSLMTFLEQPFVTTTKERAERATRRRLGEHMPEPEPLVSVIRLRRPRAVTQPCNESEPIEWSHRWVVSGHWHRYHSNEGIKTLWLLPYVKGPEDKPLKPPRAKVFAVVR